MPLEKLHTRLQERPYLWAYIAGSGLLLVCSVLWWFTVFLGTQHVFWSMVDNSLTTSGVVAHTKQTKGKDSLEQFLHIDTGAAHKARSLTILKQGGTEVKTEIVGTKDADYTRYFKISSTEKANTTKLQNVWAKSDDTQQSETQSSGHQLYAQAILGIGLPLGSVPVPVGSLAPDQRSTLYRSIRNQNVYKPDFAKVKKERKDGRLLYTYDVTVQTLSYISMMKDFAKDLGLHELDLADPNSFASTPTWTASLTVDAYSHQLAGVNFKSLGYSQTYSSYGLPLKVELPKSYISSTELQRRVTEATQPRP